MILDGPCSLLQTIYHEECCALLAVTIDETTGKIATASSNEVYVYRPYGKQDGLLRWSLQCTVTRHEHEPEDVALSWGTDEELLIGSKSLRLYQTATEEAEIWCQQLSKPVKLAQFSHDANLVASTGRYDRLIKLWRRQSFGASDTRFDYTYLPHPTAVTSIHWRRPHNRQHASDHVLYSICGDQKVRIWAAVNSHGVQGLQLWAEIDMQASIQPRQLGSATQTTDRFAFIIDGQDFSSAAAVVVKRVNEADSHQSHALDHLVAVAKGEPELCVILDPRGHMSAWGLENVGCKIRKPTDIFNIAHVENLNLGFSESRSRADGNTQFVSFCDQSDQPFNLLAHHFDGRIEWLGCRLDALFDPSPSQERVCKRWLWTGHDGSIQEIVRSTSGKAIISRTGTNDALIWRQRHDGTDLGLTLRSSLNCPDHIHRTWLLHEGDYVVNLHYHSISLWDARISPAAHVGTIPFNIEGQLMCLMQLPEEVPDPTILHVAIVSTKKQGLVFSISLPKDLDELSEPWDASTPSLEQLCTFSLDVREMLSFMLPVDPAGSTIPVSSSLDTFAKDIAISYSAEGRLRSWAATLDLEERTVKWLPTSMIETGIDDPCVASASSTRKAALVDASRTCLTIWDMRSGQLEHKVQYGELDFIQDLDWSTTPDNQALLAVGFAHKVLVLAQMRYDYLSTGPAWAPVREIYIKDSTPHPIGDSTWLGSGDLVVGAGNQLFVYNKSVDSSDDMVSDLFVPVHKKGRMDLFELVAFLNGTLPVFHPQFLSQCILAGKAFLVQKIICGLNKALKFYTDGDELDDFVSMTPDDFFMDDQANLHTGDQNTRLGAKDVEGTNEEFDVDLEHVASSLNEKLVKVSVPQLSSQSQIHLADIVECVSMAERHRRSMDDNAIRYLLFFRQYMIRKRQIPPNRAGISYREIVWAYHSTSQDILVDLISRQFQGRMLWEHARECGMFLWMTDLTALVSEWCNSASNLSTQLTQVQRAQFEVIARNEYTKSHEKNPIDCSLYYLALGKKNILVGLWRMASWNREQASTQRLLSNNFQEPRWKTAALKNAYALLGKRRFEYAASFFLLAGNLQDAVNVCVHQLQDLQLAIAVARVYEGDDGLVFRMLLENKVLPLAASEGNRWLATWAFWMLGKRDMAVRSLISPVHVLLDAAEAPKLEARSYLANDPALVILYKQLRGKTLQTLKGAARVSPKEEWDFVIQNARMYDRMGCDLLALDLVRNWEFLNLPKEVPSKDEALPDPRKMLRRRSSLVVDDLTSPKSPREMRTGMGKPPPQKVFEEPEASSLLDSFGF
ncbi:MAG: hypothetical protein Q9208_002142 [Pyrenodesmia sp. 3 TL-2023]